MSSQDEVLKYLIRILEETDTWPHYTIAIRFWAEKEERIEKYGQIVWRRKISLIAKRSLKRSWRMDHIFYISLVELTGIEKSGKFGVLDATCL